MDAARRIPMPVLSKSVLSKSGPVQSKSGLPLLGLVALFCLIWSSAFAVSKLALSDAPPLLLLTGRFLIAGLVVLAVTLWWGADWRLRPRDLASLVLIGVANNAVYLGLNYVGMRSVSSGVTALIASANPVLTSLLAALVLGELLSWRKAIGLALGVGGVAYVVDSRIAGGAESLVGILFVTGGLVSLVAGTILFKRLAPKSGLLVGNAVQNLASGAVLAPFAFASESLGDIVPTWRLAGALLYLALLGSVCAYLIWLHLITVAGAAAASSFHFMMPPLGLAFGWLVLGEHATPTDFIGIVPVALGIYLVTQQAKPRPRTSAVQAAPAR
jgi:drug/metabolite transporter (DMT)-like permease